MMKYNTNFMFANHILWKRWNAWVHLNFYTSLCLHDTFNVYGIHLALAAFVGRIKEGGCFSSIQLYKHQAGHELWPVAALFCSLIYPHAEQSRWCIFFRRFQRDG